LQSTGEAITSDLKIGPINNFIHSLFSHIHIELNNTCITQTSGLYSYRSLLENLLNYGYDARESHLLSSGFVKDTAGSMDGSDSNLGHAKRRTQAGVGEFDLESPIHADIFNLNSLMLSNVAMVIKFYKSKPEFCLMGPPSETSRYTLKITDAQLLVRKVKLASAVAIAHETALSSISARYFITRVEVKHFSIPKDLMSHSVSNLFLGKYK
jgi:hypothetical protein